MDEPQLPPARDRLLALACVTGIIICLAMTALEFSRALEGNPRSLAYTFEWPAFAAFIIWIWRRLERRNQQERRAQQEALAEPHAEGNRPNVLMEPE